MQLQHYRKKKEEKEEENPIQTLLLYSPTTTTTIDQEIRSFNPDIVKPTIVGLHDRIRQLESQNQYLSELLIEKSQLVTSMSRTLAALIDKLSLGTTSTMRIKEKETDQKREKQEKQPLNDKFLAHFIDTSFNRLHTIPKYLQKDTFSSDNPFYYIYYKDKKRRYLTSKQIKRLKEQGILAGCVGPVCNEARAFYYSS